MASNPNNDLFDRFGLDLCSEVCSQMDFEDCSSSSSSCSSSSSSSSPSGFSAASRPPGLPSPKRKAGRKKFRETRHPVYHGVRARDGGKWVCEVREPRKKTRIWLGTYTTPESAAIAHDAAAVALRGGSAHLNFPLLAPSLPRARSTAPEDVRRAAAEAAAGMVVRSNPPPAGRKDEAETSASAPPHPTPEFVDEEAVFNMPALLEDMARGLLITPPGMQTGFDSDAAEECCDADTWRLWADDN